jgi:hypothetical protein
MFLKYKNELIFNINIIEFYKPINILSLWVKMLWLSESRHLFLGLFL